MYIECIASFFTSCIWDKLYESNLETYKRSLTSFKRGITVIENRKKLYENIVLYFNLDSPNSLTNISFVNRTITEFFGKYVIDSNYIFELFDKIIYTALNNWLTYIYTFQAVNVVQKNNSNMLTCKTYFIRLLSKEIDKMTIELIGSTINDEKLKKINELTELMKEDKRNMVDKSTQTVKTHRTN